MSSSRRSFIKNSSIFLAGTAALPTSFNFRAGRKEERLAMQLYSVDMEMHADAEGTLMALKKMGYNHVEHANYNARRFYGYTPACFRKLLNNCGLKLLSGHTVLELQHWNKGSKQFTPQWHYAIEDAATAGQQFVISPWLDRSLWNNETELRHFMDVFNKSGELCKKAGLRFGYHNHDFEFTHTINSQRLYDFILQNTDANLVSQQLDIGNIHQTNTSLTDLFSQYPGRFELVHVKDVTETNERHQQYKSTVLGKGILDIKSILAAARKQGRTSCFIIELDSFSAMNTLESAKENYEVFNELNGLHPEIMKPSFV